MFINDISTRKRVAKGAYIYRHGAPVTSLFALRSGIAKVYDSERTLIGIVQPGQVIGAEELFMPCHHYDVQAACDIEVCELQNRHFYQISQITSDFTLFMINILSRSAREKQRFISVMVQSDGIKKIRGFLQLLCELNREYGFEHRCLTLPVSKKELAQLLGISLSTLTRALETLVEQQIITVNKKNITLLAEEKKHG
ncbi:Crp/Fnr family transcriptional regulator [Enterobacteriaceae bacterium 4M9]|nr:Crp/Fnr family transcriptional regulator [Enterobacteriaceae bacterium 4M9]